MARRRSFNWSPLLDWANQVLAGKTFYDDNTPWTSYEEAHRTGPSRRTKAAVLTYVEAHNARRYRRLRSDFQWLKQMMREMGADPEDARFLL